MEGLGFSNYDSNLKTNNQLATSTLNTTFNQATMFNYPPNDLFNPTRTSQSGVSQGLNIAEVSNNIESNVVVSLGSSASNIDITNPFMFSWDQCLNTQSPGGFYINNALGITGKSLNVRA